MLSELIATFISQTQNLTENLSSLQDLKADVHNTLNTALNDEALKEKIHQTLYFYTDDFAKNVASKIDIQSVAQQLNKQTLQEIIQDVMLEIYTPQSLATELIKQVEFQNALKISIQEEVKKAVNITLLLDGFQSSLQDQIASLTKQELKNNKIDKFMFESALMLFIIRLHAKSAMIEIESEELNKLNLLKRI